MAVLLLFTSVLLTGCFEEEAIVEDSSDIEVEEIEVQKISRYKDEEVVQEKKVYRGLPEDHVVYHERVSGSLSAELPISKPKYEKPISRGTLYDYQPIEEKDDLLVVNFEEDEEERELSYEEFMGVRYSPELGYIESVEIVTDIPDEEYTEASGAEYRGEEGYVDRFPLDYRTQGYVENFGYHRDDGYVEHVDDDREDEGYTEYLDGDRDDEGYTEYVDDSREDEGYLEYYYRDCVDEEDEEEKDEEKCERIEGYLESLDGAGHGKDGYIRVAFYSEEQNYVENFESSSTQGYVESFDLGVHEGYVENFDVNTRQGYVGESSASRNEGYVEGYVQSSPSYSVPGYNITTPLYYRDEGYIQNSGAYSSQGYIETHITDNPSVIAEAKRFGFY